VVVSQEKLIAIGSDHGAWDLKELVKTELVL